MLRVVSAKYAGAYRFEVELSDGHLGVADLEGLLNGAAFRPLRDVAVFQSGAVDPALGTLAWPPDIDIAPEYLLFLIARDEPSLHERFEQWGYLEGGASRRATVAARA